MPRRVSSILARCPHALVLAEGAIVFPAKKAGILVHQKYPKKQAFWCT
jgi:hypothetical protein